MKTSFFVLAISLLYLVALTHVHATTLTTQLETSTNSNMMNTCDTEQLIRFKINSGLLLLPVNLDCSMDQSIIIGKITMNIESSTTPKKYSYYIVDYKNYFLASKGQLFVHDSYRSKLNNYNCTTDSKLSRYDTTRYVMVEVHDFEPEDIGNVFLYYNIKAFCGPSEANSVDVQLSVPNPKYYYGSQVLVDFVFFNDYSTDTFLNGKIKVEGQSLTGIVKKGRCRMLLTLLDEYKFGKDVIAEFTSDSSIYQKKLPAPIPMPKLVRKAAKGDLLLHKNQVIYSGKDFTLYFTLLDSDNQPTPTIDIPLLSISSTDPNVKLYCQITNYVNGYGFVSCENIDTSGQHTIVLKYDGLTLDEADIIVEENPYQYVNETVVLLLVILVIASMLILCLGIVAFVIFYKKLNKQNVKTSRPTRVSREEDAEELDNL